ncbi:aldo/keto reductase [Nocardia sp. NPDC058114]|uniref:aldo/keto reductase n=1 Tax=Nocardia sp. NPDC058114 TaxID=3346346 RepID=UPI0036D9BB32
MTALKDTVAALDDLVRVGKIRYYDTSIFSPGELIEAQWIADRTMANHSATEQVPRSPLIHGSERETLPIAREYGVGVITYGPLAAGWLSGNYRLGTP